MSNHPGRNPAELTAFPTSEMVFRLREASGLTQDEAGKLLHSNGRSWGRWERPEGNPDTKRNMHWAFFELFVRKAPQYLPADKAKEFRRLADELVNLKQLGVK